MNATELHATRLAEAQARIAAELARRGPAAAKALSDRMEHEADVAAMIAAVPERIERRYRWSCAKCAEPMRTAERPPTPQLCARCRPERLEAYTEPATRPVYGDESEDDGLPIVTNNPAPSAPVEERTVTATATKESPAKAAEKKPEPSKPGGRSCGCRYNGSHRKSCPQAPKPVPAQCGGCGRTFPSASAINGHRRACSGSKQAAPPVGAKRPEPTPALTSGGTVAICLPDLRAYVVRLRGPVPLEIECATVEDAAAFVRAVQAGK